jgi:bifunctional non-homologous end joining protein LigD
MAGEAAALVWAAGAGRVEWTSKVQRAEAPAFAFVDLAAGWEDLRVLARLHRTAFEHLGVAARAQLDGRGGLQIWVPVERGTAAGEMRAWVRALCRSVGAVVPDVARRSRMRPGSFVAPYSPRAVPGAPVAAPIAWDELDDPALRPDGFTIRTIGERLSARGDLFSGVLHQAQRLPPLQ